MTSSALVLGVVLATLLRTQTLFSDAKIKLVFSGLGSIVLLILPLIAILILNDFGLAWRNYFYFISLALSYVLLVWKFQHWEEWWSLALLWTLLPLIYSNDNLGMWLALMTSEFLLILAYQDIRPASDYHKYSLLRLMVIFQFFVFEHLFLQARPAWAGEILALLLILLYLLGLIKISKKLLSSKTIHWLFLLAYLQYGTMMIDKILIDAFSN
jgi:hypothetical protein